jgi:hypothetical protein
MPDIIPELHGKYWFMDQGCKIAGEVVDIDYGSGWALFKLRSGVKKKVMFHDIVSAVRFGFSCSHLNNDL